MTLDGISVLFAQMVPQPNAEGQEIKLVLMMVAFAVIMWFLMIAPQRKKAKELETTLKALKAGDKIVTSSGIVGVVLSIKDRTISIRSAETKLEVLKSTVAEITDRTGDASESKS
jgi:preprotein translocase subunit YajC